MSDDTLKTLGLSEDALTPSTDPHAEPLTGPIDESPDDSHPEAIPRVSTQKRRPSDYARSFIQQKFALQSNRAQVVFERVYGRTDANLTFLTVSIADRGMLKLAERLEVELDRRFTRIEADLEAASAECDRLFDDRRVPVANRRALSDKTRIYDVPLRTNFSARFLQLFTRFDELLCRVEALWINGIIRATGRSQMIEKWDRQVRSFTGTIRSLRDRTQQELNKLRAEGQGQQPEGAHTHETPSAGEAHAQNHIEEQPETDETEAPIPSEDVVPVNAALQTAAETVGSEAA